MKSSQPAVSFANINDTAKGLTVTVAVSVASNEQPSSTITI